MRDVSAADQVRYHIYITQQGYCGLPWRTVDDFQSFLYKPYTLRDQ